MSKNRNSLSYFKSLGKNLVPEYDSRGNNWLGCLMIVEPVDHIPSRAAGIRTLDLHDPNVALYQAELRPDDHCRKNIPSFFSGSNSFIAASFYFSLDGVWVQGLEQKPRR